MPDSPDAADPKPGSARPSFTGYWKRSKDKQAAQSLTFVSSKLGQTSAHGGDGAQTEPSTEAKAKERRQQVRRAQRQHRQRKANYTKQLEMDVTKLRDDIARVELAIGNLKDQNDTMRCQLATPTAVTVPPVDVMDTAFSTLLAPNYTVSLDMSELLGAPVYQVRRVSPPAPDRSSEATSSHAAETLSSTTPTSTAGTSCNDIMAMETILSQEQTDRVVNFILSLERCCWDHIDKSCFEHHYHHSHSHSQPQPQTSFCPIAAGVPDDNNNNDNDNDIDIDIDIDIDDNDNTNTNNVSGHALMATTLALQSAPPDVFARISELQKEQSPASACAPVEWSSNTLTLSNLRRLARTLNPSDSELAPVQAWYELARLYGVVVATDPAVLAGLERALAGEVQCVVFGAVVRRNVFEDALERVVGLVPRRWDGEIGLEGEVVDFGGEEVQGGDGEGMEMEMEDEDEMADEMAATQGEKKRTGAGSGILGRLIHTAKGRK